VKSGRVVPVDPFEDGTGRFSVDLSVAKREVEILYGAVGSAFGKEQHKWAAREHPMLLPE
jgi:hypothetical protein